MVKSSVPVPIGSRPEGRPRSPRSAIAIVLLALATSPAGSGELPAGDPRAEGFRPETLDKIRPVLEDAVARRKVAGAITLVARRGKVVHLATAGLRDVEAGRPLDR